MRSDSSVRWRFVIAMVAAGVIAVSVVAVAQTEDVERFTATTVNMQPEGRPSGSTCCAGSRRLTGVTCWRT